MNEENVMYPYNEISFSLKKKNEILKFVTTWTNLGTYTK